MVVIDASILVEALLGTPLGTRALATLVDDDDWHVPDLADLEVTSVLRGLARSGRVEPDRAVEALTDLQDLPATRWPAGPLLGRAWQLRDALTIYDAAYVALAEALDARLVTADLRLARGAAAVSPVVVVTP